MKMLGKVVSMSDNKLVLKTDKLVKLGSKVYDERQRFIGNVIDYFGPTMGPYLLVSAKRGGESLVGKELFQ
ncbi:hypothetical protein HYS54_00905 [Candidatus Micrarchaeota archaeon]|nr:hypothetical protein [Candidatus Micrarchaeota archaeon]